MKHSEYRDGEALMKRTKTEKFMKMWEKERRKGKDRYVAYRTVLLGVGMMVGSTMGRMLRGEPFFLDYFVFIAGAIGGSIGSVIAWKRSEARYLRILQEEGHLGAQDGSDRMDGDS
jgi:hypothetical protein